MPKTILHINEYCYFYPFGTKHQFSFLKFEVFSEIQDKEFGRSV
jgi:hypothetical protein